MESFFLWCSFELLHDMADEPSWGSGNGGEYDGYMDETNNESDLKDSDSDFEVAADPPAKVQRLREVCLKKRRRISPSSVGFKTGWKLESISHAKESLAPSQYLHFHPEVFREACICRRRQRGSELRSWTLRHFSGILSPTSAKNLLELVYRWATASCQLIFWYLYLHEHKFLIKNNHFSPGTKVIVDEFCMELPEHATPAQV